MGTKYSGTIMLWGSCGVYFNNIIIHPDGGSCWRNYLQTYKKQTGTVVNGQGSWDVLLLDTTRTEPTLGLQRWGFRR